MTRATPPEIRNGKGRLHGLEAGLFEPGTSASATDQVKDSWKSPFSGWP
jgi:hypothetical protein